MGLALATFIFMEAMVLVVAYKIVTLKGRVQIPIASPLMPCSVIGNTRRFDRRIPGSSPGEATIKLCLYFSSALRMKNNL